VRGHIINSFIFAGHTFSVTIIQLCYCGMKAVTNNK
jgi:hypothetical protein